MTTSGSPPLPQSPYPVHPPSHWPPPPPPPSASGVPAEVRWGLGDVGWGMLLFFVGQLGLMGLGIVGAIVIGGDSVTDDLSNGVVPLPVLVMSIVGGWLGLVGWPVWCTYRKGQRSLARDFGLRGNWGDVGWGVLAGLACLAISVALALLWQLILGGDPPSNGDFLDDSGRGVGQFLLLFVLIAVCTPIAEELFFRGLLMRSLGKRFNLRIAVVVSSVVFGLMHATGGSSIGAGLFIAFVTGLYGLVLAMLVAWRDGRLGGSITAHMVINGVQVIALFALGSS